jgi:hypothetical protein
VGNLEPTLRELYFGEYDGHDLRMMQLCIARLDDGCSLEGAEDRKGVGQRGMRKKGSSTGEAQGAQAQKQLRRVCVVESRDSCPELIHNSSSSLDTTVHLPCG